MLKRPSRFALVFVVILLAGPAARAIPPAIVIPHDLMQTKLLRVHRKLIADRIEWWKQVLLSARTDEDLRYACEKLLGDYQLYPNRFYQNEFAEETVAQCTDVLTGKALSADDPLRTQKIINIALVLTRMHRLPVAPALQYMVASDNEALRFIGFQGYLALREAILQAGASGKTPLLDALRRSATEETNPLILTTVFQIMNPDGAADLPDSARLAAEKEFLPILQAVWDAQRKQFLTLHSDDDSDRVEAVRAAATAVAAIGRDANHTSDGKTRTTCLQMILDLAQSAAKAYDLAWSKQGAYPKLLIEYAELLTACEKALNKLAGTNHTFLAEKTDRKRDVPGRGAAVREAVLNWTDALKDQGVHDPAEPK